MRYLGGKKRLAKQIAKRVDEFRPDGASVWEPFCGGAAVTTELAKLGPVDASDLCEPLITMWRSLLDGWVPDPREATEQRYRACREAQDPSDPWTAFMGFGCSYGGKWFGGYTGWSWHTSHNQWQFYPLFASNTLLKQREVMKGRVRFSVFDFVAHDRADWPSGWPIYCDPPYVDTTGYSATGSFDHDAFWARVATYALRGCPVFVSEFAAPPALGGVRSECVWRKPRKNQMNGSDVVDRLDLFTAE